MLSLTLITGELLYRKELVTRSDHFLVAGIARQFQLTALKIFIHLTSDI